jgi:hypothetical protein
VVSSHTCSASGSMRGLTTSSYFSQADIEKQMCPEFLLTSQILTSLHILNNSYCSLETNGRRKDIPFMPNNTVLC